MLNCSWSKVWRGLRLHQDSICIKFAVIVFACCGLCMVCYFVESPKAKVSATADRGVYQHKQRQSRVQIDAAASDMNVQDLRSSEKLIQIQQFLNEDSEPLQLSSSNNIAHASDPYEGSGHADGEVSPLMASSNGIAMPTERVPLLNDELFLDVPGDSMGSAAADIKSVQLPEDSGEINGDNNNNNNKNNNNINNNINNNDNNNNNNNNNNNKNVNNNNNNNVVVTLQEAANTDEQDLSGKWLSDEQEYFLNDYGPLNGGDNSPAMVVSDEQFIVSPEDRGNFVQISDATDAEGDDDYDSRYLESPRFINSLLGQMKGLFEPPPKPFLPPAMPLPVASPIANFGELPFSNAAGLETQASQYQPTWNKPQPLVPPAAAVSWFDVWKGPEAPRTPPRNPFQDYLQQMERFFKGPH